MAGGIIQEVGPVGVRLHESELKQLPKTKPQELEADLGWEEGATDISEPCAPVKPSEAWRRTMGLGCPVSCAPEQHPPYSPMSPTYLVPDILAQALALVQRDPSSQLHAQHPCRAQLLNNGWHPKEGVVCQQLPGADGRGGDGTSHFRPLWPCSRPPPPLRSLP